MKDPKETLLNLLIFAIGFAAGFMACAIDVKEQAERIQNKPVPIFTNEQAADALDCLAEKEQGE